MKLTSGTGLICRAAMLTIVVSSLLGHLEPASATEPMRQGPVRPHISARHAPIGTPHQASSFAPRARSNRRVYGAPIQPPILSRVKPKQPTPR